MRGQWEEAADLCIDVLHREPNNGTAHSLLGDIYQDQGRPEEARHWYQLALEQNPGSTADRAKLARAQEMLEARDQRAEWQAVIEGRRQPVATSLLVRESVQRIAAIAGAILCGIILVMAAIVTVTDRSPGVSDEGGALGSAPRRVMVPDTGTEQALFRKTREAAGSGVAQLVRLELDPPNPAARIRVFLPRTRRVPSPSEFHDRVMREGYRFARALHNSEHTLTAIGVTVVRPAANGETELIFSGQLAAEDLVVPPERATPQELESLYTSITPPVWTANLSP